MASHVNPRATVAGDSTGVSKSKYIPLFAKGRRLEILEFYSLHTRLFFMFMMWSADFFQKILSGSNSLDPNQDQNSVGPDPDSNCLRRDVAADSKSGCYTSTKRFEV